MGRAGPRVRVQHLARAYRCFSPHAAHARSSFCRPVLAHPSTLLRPRVLLWAAPFLLPFPPCPPPPLTPISRLLCGEQSRGSRRPRAPRCARREQRTHHQGAPFSLWLIFWRAWPCMTSCLPACLTCATVTQLGVFAWRSSSLPDMGISVLTRPAPKCASPELMRARLSLLRTPTRVACP